MNYNKKSQEHSRRTIGGVNNVHEHMCGNFELNATDIWDDLAFNDDDHHHDDDDDTPVKQDYDLDNLYSREQPIIEEETTDSMSEDDDNMDHIDTHDQMVLTDIDKTSGTSNKETQFTGEERALSQKFSQLSTSSNSHQTKSSASNKKIKENVQINNLDRIPDYLTKLNKSFQNMVRSLLPMDTVSTRKLEDFRQLAIFIHHIKYNEILYSLWTVYLKSGLGELQSKYDLQNTFNAQVWPMPVKSRVKIDIRSGINEHDACLTFVKDRLSELDKDIQQSQSNLHDHMNRLSDDSLSIIRQAIETFLEEKLSDLRKKIQFKIQLTNHYYDERILELQYLRHNPTEVQIQLANQCCIARQQKEMTKHELELLEKRITHHCYSSSLSSFDNLSISRVPLFDSINNVNLREQLYTEYRQVIEQSKKDMFNLYMSCATTQMERYQREYRDEFKRIREDQKLAPFMIDLIERRGHIIAERIKCIYNFKAQTLSVQS